MRQVVGFIKMVITGEDVLLDKLHEIELNGRRCHKYRCIGVRNPYAKVTYQQQNLPINA